MKTTAVRLYGENDLRLESFELPAIKDDEILVKIISDSICMSSYKAAHSGRQPQARARATSPSSRPSSATNSAARSSKVGAKWEDKFKAGEKFAIQPAINYKGSAGLTPGYSYRVLSAATPPTPSFPPEVMEHGLPARLQGRRLLLCLPVRAAELHHRHVPRPVSHQARLLCP